MKLLFYILSHMGEKLGVSSQDQNLDHAREQAANECTCMGVLLQTRTLVSFLEGEGDIMVDSCSLKVNTYFGAKRHLSYKGAI
jgi:hypothetical protein